MEDKVVPRITQLIPVNQYQVKKNGLAKSKVSIKRIRPAIVIGLNTPVEIDVL